MKNNKTKIELFNSNQIGGCVTIISTEKAKICIDFGENLPGSKNSKVLEIKGLNTGKKDVEAVFFTHYHGDHIGRMKDVLKEIQLYIGETARKVLYTIGNTVKDTEICKILEDNKRTKTYKENETVTIGDIQITAFSVDHSAYDAYMFLIETPDKTILHTGDLRTHGWRGNKLFDVVNKYILQFGKRKVDILITEGTMMSRCNEKHYSEPQMMQDVIKIMKEHKYVFLICSSTNLDSLATFYQAGQLQVPKRKMYGNKYVLEQLKNFSETAGKWTSLYDFTDVEPVMFDYITNLKDGTKITQEERMKKYGCIIVIKGKKNYEKWINRFENCTDKPILIYSMWSGYINPNCDAYDSELAEICDKYNAIKLHTSGHIYPDDLAKLITLINPQEKIIPIHTENAHEFYELNISNELKEKIDYKE